MSTVIKSIRQSPVITIVEETLSDDSRVYNVQIYPLGLTGIELACTSKDHAERLVAQLEDCVEICTF